MPFVRLRSSLFLSVFEMLGLSLTKTLLRCCQTLARRVLLSVRAVFDFGVTRSTFEFRRLEVDHVRLMLRCRALGHIVKRVLEKLFDRHPDSSLT